MDWSRRDTIALALTDRVVFVNPRSLDVTEPGNVPPDIVSLKFSPFGERLFLGGDLGTGTLYDALRREPCAAFPLFESSVLAADWKDDMIVAGSREGCLAVVDPRAPGARTFAGHSEEVCAVRIHPTAPLCAACGNDCAVRIWDLRCLGGPPRARTRSTRPRFARPRGRRWRRT